MSNIKGIGDTYLPSDITLDKIQKPVDTVDLNQQNISNIKDPIQAQDGVNLQYLQGNYLNTVDSHLAFLEADNTNINTLIAQTADYSCNNHKITNLSTCSNNYEASNKLYVDQQDQVQQAYTDSQISAVNTNLSTNYYNKTQIDTNNYTKTQTDSLLAGKLNTSVTLDQIQKPVATLDMNSQKISNLVNGTSQQDAVTLNQLQNTSVTKIQDSTSATKVQANATNVQFDLGGNTNKLKLFTAIGQATQPLVLQANDKFQMISDLGSFSFNNGLAQNQLLNNFGVYVTQGNNDMTKNQNVQFCLQCSNNSGSQQSQCLTLASGHIDLGQGAGMQNYSLIYNKSPDGVQQNLQISGGTPNMGTDATLNLYSTSFANTYGFANKIQFTDKTGYSQAVSITDNYQFPNKLYVDTSILGLSSVYQTISGMSSYYTKTQSDSNYYSKTASDAKYSLITTPLNSLTIPTESLNLNSQKIINLLTPTLSTDACNKSYTDGLISGLSSVYQPISGMSSYYTSAQVDSSFYNKTTSDSKYTLQSTPLNSLTVCAGSLNLNSQKIINLLAPSLSTDATNKAYVDSSIGALSSIYQTISGMSSYYTSAQVDSSFQTIAGMNNYYNKTQSDAKYQLISDMTNYYTKTGSDSIFQTISGMSDYSTTTQADSRYYLNTTTLNAISTPNASVSLNSQLLTNVANPVSNQDAATKSYTDGLISGLSSVYQSISNMANYFTKTQSDARYYLNSNTLDQISVPVSSVSLNSQKITSLADPTSNQDASTKYYVDQQIAGISVGASSPIGSIVMYCSTTIPANYLECNGQAYNTTTYAVLFSVLGSANVPDLRGKFVRGNDPTNLYDPDTRSLMSTQLQNVGQHTHSIPSLSGSGTTSTAANHTHRENGYTASGIGSSSSTSTSNADITIYNADGLLCTGGKTLLPDTDPAGAHNHTVTITTTADTTGTNNSVADNRPVNMNLVYIIKAL